MASETDTENPRRFLDPKVIAKIAHLDLRAAQMVDGFITGLHRSKFFGHSVEFVQHRDYVRGDDIRHLDWKVWSKTDRFYVKQFEAETNLRCQIVLDVSESMHYGSGPLNKYEYASTAAAAIAYLLVRQQDSVGITTFDSDIRMTIPPRSSQQHLDAICKTMHVSKPREKTDMLKIMKKVTESIHHRGIVAIITDGLSDREPLLKGLDMLRIKKQDVMLFHVLDDDEINFPFNGMTRFEGMEELPDLFCDPKALRDGYLDELEKYLVEMRQGCAKRGIDYTLVKTSDTMDAILSKFLHSRLDPRAKARVS